MNEQDNSETQVPPKATKAPDSDHEAVPETSEKDATPAPQNIWPGSSLDWSSPKVDVRLYVELPFWLMMPDGIYDVTYEETTLQIEVAHQCDEGQTSRYHLKNHPATVFIKRDGEKAPEDVVARLNKSEDGWSIIVHRTTLIISTKIIQSVLDATRGEDPVKLAHAGAYLNSLAVGHVPLANALITAYRRASYDPFAQDVTEATVPIWFLRHGDEFTRLSIYPYHDHAWRPRAPVEGDVPLDLATREEVVKFLDTPETPGESILMDAWSYYYTGRFSDSIRALITSVEVLLEAKLAELHRAKGKTPDQVEAALNVTATKFLSRLDEYAHLSGRTIPGPQLSVIPYINGVRLRQELIDTRELRHRIVHGGHRVHPHAYGSMLRAIETITGFFSWLDGDLESASRRFSYYQLKSELRGRVILGVEYLPDVVSVVEFLPTGVKGGDIVFAGELLTSQHQRALYGPEKDLDLFVKMSLACILSGSAHFSQALHNSLKSPIEDRHLLKPGPGVVGERYLWSANSQVVLAVFALDFDGLLTPMDLAGVMVRLLQLRVELKKLVYGLCIVNHQRHLEPSRRQEFTTLGEDLEAHLGSCGVSLMFASDLAHYLIGASNLGWSLEPLQKGIQKPGYCPCAPPNAVVAGEFIKPFPRQSAIGIQVLSPVEVGCLLYVRTNRGFELVTAESIQLEKTPLKEVRNGLVGVKINANVNEVIEGSLVYRIIQPQPAPAAANENSQK
jgi:hypothetical protein